MKNEVNRVLVAEKKNLYLAPVTELHTMLSVSNLLAGSGAGSSNEININNNTPADSDYLGGGD